MSEIPVSKNIRRFVNDLRRIREARGLTLQGLHDETKIPVDLLEQFEAQGLQDHPGYNEVYLRSFVRAYATFLGISEELALQSVHEMLHGKYRGGLAVKYLGEKPDPLPVEPKETDSAVSRPVPVKTQEIVPPVQELPKKNKISYKYPEKKLSQTRSWVLQTQWIWVGAVVIVLLVALWFMFSFIKWSAPEEEVPLVQEEIVPVDTVAVEPRVPVRPQVGDTLDITVLATDKVERMLVRRDDELRRHIWMEEGGTESFGALNQIIFENRLNKIRLFLEGYEYPITGTDERGRLVITRTIAQAFLDTVQAPPVLPLEK